MRSEKHVQPNTDHRCLPIREQYQQHLKIDQPVGACNLFQPRYSGDHEDRALARETYSLLQVPFSN
jgi:hypothetical protein